MSKLKQPNLVVDAAIKKLEDVIQDLKAINGDAPPPEPKKQPKESAGHIRAGIEVFTKLYHDRFSVYPYYSQSDKFMLGKLHKDLGDDLAKVIDEYLAIEDDRFLNDNSHAPRFMASRVASIQQKLAGNAPKSSQGDWR